MSEESSSSKLDNFSKEELIKLIKKYVILQKQLKAKNEELTNRLNESNSQNFSPEKFSNKKLEEENLELKEHIQLLSKQIEELNRVSHEYDSFRIEIQPQLENARNEIELNKSMLDMLNSEIQMLNSEKLQLEKRLYITRRNTPPSIIIEEDEEDLEEEERNSSFHIQPCQVYRLNPIEEEDLQQQHNNDINFLKQSNELGPDGILILNKQVEDLTFYVDELKSELEAEREKNNEYLNEIKEYRKQIEDFEEQHEFSNNELRLENDRLQKECCDALLRVSEKEKEIADLICSAQQVNVSTSDSILNGSCTHYISNSVKPSNANTIEQFVNVFLAEIIDKQNYDFDFKLIDQFGESEHVLKQINFLTSKLKQTENTNQTKLEQIIKDFKEEINLIENELTNKKNEFNAYKLQIDTKLKSLQCELDNEKEKTKELKKFEKEASKNKMLDLEIADYDRSIKSLNVQLIARDKEANDLKAEINSQNEAIIRLKHDLDTAIKEKEQSDEKCTKMKQLLVKAKKEVSDAKAHEAEHLSNDVQLKAQLENSFLEIENQKLQMAQLTIECQRLQDKLQACNESNQITVQSLETKLKQADDTYLECNENFISLKTEYENYKLKVQHAFKKQKEQNESNITNSQAKSDLQKYLAEIEHLNHTIIKLNKTLDEKTEKAKLLDKENEFIQNEYAKSLDRNTKLLSELKEKENEWKSKFQEIKQENSLKTDETLQTIKELQNEKDYQANSFKEKLRQLNIQNMQTISMLQAQLEESKEEIDKLNKKFSEIKNTSLDSNTVPNYMNTTENTPTNSSPTSFHSNKLFSSPSIKNDFTNSFQRHLGLHENANSNDSSKLSKTLEQLLNEPLPAQTINPLDSKAILGQIEQLKNELNKAKTQLEHLNELLNESELNNSRLTEQINVLKEEIRRLERNQEREKSISNMEYLKNVVYKFLTFSTREEKVQLLPVLSTMLKLTQEEQNEIMNVKGPTSTGENRWTTYLPKWTN